MYIPVELREQVARNNVILMLGHGINQGKPDEHGLPTFKEIGQELAKRSQYIDSNLSFVQIAQQYEMEFGRPALISYIRDRLNSSDRAPLQIYRNLVRLPFRVIITTCLDDQLENALRDAHQPFTSIIRNTDVAYQDENKTLLVKMYGDLEQPDTVVLTEMDHLRLINEVTNISDVVNGLIASRTLFLLGYDLDDSNFKQLYDRVTRKLDRHARRSYAFYEQATSYALKWWKLQNMETIPAPTASLLQGLELQLQKQQRRPAPGPAPQPGKIVGDPNPILRRPYKFLNAYQAEDASIFFGRDQEQIQILSKIVSYRLVLLYGKSGAGKTSIIQAGLIPTLEANQYHPVYTRTLANPHAAIARAINNTLKQALPEQSSLHAYVKQASAATDKLLIIFIDQFEELFRQVEISAEMRTAFIQDLGAVFSDETLQLKIVLSFREDYLAELHAFAKDTPTIFDNYFRLERLSLEQARDAIFRPAQLCGYLYEPELIEQLLKDLGGDKIDPPQLQIVCDTLYEALEPDETLITCRHYEQLGKAETILTNYLDQVLKRYTSEQRDTIQKLLIAFVSRNDNKSVLTIRKLANRTGLPEPAITRLLDDLLRARLVRRVETETQYELAHEYLINRITSWMSDKEKGQQHAQEMLEQGLRKWANFELPLYRDEFAIVDTQREAIPLTPEAERLLVYSAMQADYNAEYWVGRVPEPLKVEVLSKTLTSNESQTRRRAAYMIGRFNVQELLAPLKDHMLTDQDEQVRREATLSLVSINSAYLIEQLNLASKDSSVQDARTLEAMEYIQQAGLIEAVGALDWTTRWQIRWLRVQRNRQQLATLALYGLFGGLVGGAFGGALGTWLFSTELYVSLGMAAASIVGLLVGLGIGGGFGVAKAMQEPRHSMLYIMGTLMGGAIMGAVAGMNTVKTLETFLLAIGLGVLGGGASGMVIALIMNATLRIVSPVRRIITRGLLALPGGSATSGVMLGLVVQLGLAPPGVRPPYGFLVGVFSSVGIVVGMDLAERQLNQPQPRA